MVIQCRARMNTQRPDHSFGVRQILYWPRLEDTVQLQLHWWPNDQMIRDEAMPDTHQNSLVKDMIET